MPIVGHGVDLTEIDRVARMLDEHGVRFRDRVFTAAEQSYAEAARRGRAERYAARFAGKEAVLKALGTGLRGGMRWTEIAFEHTPRGGPVVALSGRCRVVADGLGVVAWHVSFSHVRGPGGESHGSGLALASVIAWGEEPLRATSGAGC
ncbi:MAG: holo-ACP synthase [Phycisphaerales bacterium]|nr:holo-ACP synthase [Phycisphaerae bacterium]NNF42005.1 holo-ACP synthase [Phycisphaerales bacterium]NNM24825.1 holo-ACP synthase [Phycisphaerales bacterium]